MSVFPCMNIFHDTDSVVKVGGKWIHKLINSAVEDPSQRARLCLHRDIQDPVQNMVIAATPHCLFPPHQHPHAESLFIIYGCMQVLIFNRRGKIEEKISIGSNVGMPGCHIRPNRIHTIWPCWGSAVFHEIAQGPWREGNTIVPEWASEWLELEKRKKGRRGIEETYVQDAVPCHS